MNYRLYFPATVVSDPVAIALPDPVRGYSDDPLLASWKAKSAAGMPVTPAERNTFIASLAWTADMLALPPVPNTFASMIAPNPSATAPTGAALVLGARGFVAGDVTIAATRPAGDAAETPPPSEPPAVPPAPTSVTFTTAQRYAAWIGVQAALNALALTPDQMTNVSVTPAPAGDPITMVILASAGVLAVAIAGYSFYAAYTGNTRITVAGHEREVRIQEHRDVAIVTAQVQGRSDALSQRIAAAKQGVIIPETAAETAPIVVPTAPRLVGEQPPADPNAWQRALAEGATKALLWTGVATVVVAGALIGGDTYLSRKAQRVAT